MKKLYYRTNTKEKRMIAKASLNYTCSSLICQFVNFFKLKIQHISSSHVLFWQKIITKRYFLKVVNECNIGFLENKAYILKNVNEINSIALLSIKSMNNSCTEIHGLIHKPYLLFFHWKKNLEYCIKSIWALSLKYYTDWYKVI